ncbi:E3 SUMO-protein ligase ZBED1-like [Syngnathus typhle]|uniref:E3 SUMO-protein ligase ZBED1-like n=1 Tax=Syngnathus typhle TaxID=161592 RepID=UPI002A6A1D9C|nr:E3 SUMO-protein ligase ZBED1-like [Syngnathus typhle]
MASDEDICSPLGLKSFVWRHFGFQKKDGSTDKRRAVCKFCHAVIKYSGNTTNLAAHLKKKHDISPSSSDRENNTDTTPSVNTFFPQMLSKNSKRAKSITAAISYHICKDLRQFSSVEGEGFSELMNTLEPRYTIPSRQYFSETRVPRLYTCVKAEVLHELKEAGRVAITADGWTSRSTEAYISVCEDDMPLIKEMKQTMAKELKHRYTDVQERRDAMFKNIINEAAHLWDQKEDTQAHDGTAMEETHTTHPSEEACDDELHASEYVPVSKKNKAMEDLFGDTYTASSNFVKTSKQLAEMEVYRYKETELLTLKGNLLEWWGSHEMEFPLLANLAKTYLCIPATSVPSERVFSTAGDIVRSERSVLTPEHVDHLIFLKKNLTKNALILIIINNNKFQCTKQTCDKLLLIFYYMYYWPY